MKVELKLEDFLNALDRGDFITLMQAAQINEIWGTPLSQLPFDKYYLGMCECLWCKKKSFNAWPGVDNKSKLMECPFCHKMALLPVTHDLSDP